MMYSVEWSHPAEKALSKLEKEIIKRILLKVEAIKQEPFQYIKELTNDARFSLRVGDYRVLLNMDRKERKILVLTVGHRRNIYKR
ncbi:MAG: type II toxin-antitoxin system RelE/ParE family toxin [Candidatus Diapherotrites archaeon]